MKNYYQLKSDHPEWYAITEGPEEFKHLLDMGCDYVLEDRDPSGKAVWIHKPRK